jgi:SpoVK/Ycf46/Vps4 family AAA+-type ATPase
VCIDPDTKEHLIAQIDRFTTEREWFYSKGLPHKLTVLLYGIPGSGKTSLVQAIATHYRRNVMVLDLSMLSNSGLMFAIASLPKGSILLLEDVDVQTGAVNTRQAAATKIQSSVELKEASEDLVAPEAPTGWTPSPAEGSGTSMSMGDEIKGFGLNRESDAGLTLAGVLNALQGVIALDDIMVFMSTNHPELLDPALIRSSRVDCRYEIGAMSSDLIHEYIRNMYPETPVNPTTEFVATVGSDVQTAFMEHPRDVQGFMKMVGVVPKKPNNPPPRVRLIGIRDETA